ncbi:hypothetical protein GOP47_0010240 [Adiantum capillus-veneris]|uniref:Uncharacterized protein n=1 Tax=Adiantum capillus-veneris TaxID=13818 RepID=A0A9D4UV06_ADICA|nr:hypothetical protein GOP47_0010240 [Adiantum capillus-veneris]
MTRMRGGTELTARWNILGRCGIKPEGLEPFAGSDRRNVARRVLAQMQATDGRWIPPRQDRLQEDAEQVRWTRHHTRYEKNSNAGAGYVWPMCFPSKRRASLEETGEPLSANATRLRIVRGRAPINTNPPFIRGAVLRE